ncbi:MAG TPA: SUMF1/EgtB/PvdO family nonheme iron enzyme [Polyangia bacterium]
MSAVCANGDLVTCNAFGEASHRLCRHGCDPAGTACVIPPCPAEMRLIDELEVCIDRYEASHGPSGEALAVKGAMPWVFVSYAGAEAACELAGKRLCTEEEWVAACAGPQHNDYPFGYIYDPTACNGIDSPLGGLVPTGTAPRCEGGYSGIFDMGGNAMELTSACDGEGACKAYGGDYGADAYSMLCTAFNVASPHPPQAADGGAEPAGYGSLGFRCCLAP